MALSVRSDPTPVRTNLLGVVEHPGMGDGPYAIDRDGAPFVPVGDGGIVLGVSLGDGVFAYDADHVAPGACLVHPDPAARFALTAQAAIGNAVEVLSGTAAGARGTVLGKRGEAGRVVIGLAQDALCRLLPGDRVRVEAVGQGARLVDVEGVEVMNIDPRLLSRMPLAAAGGGVRADVRGRVHARLIGNGVGRPAALWDLDLQVTEEEAPRFGLSHLRLGDLVAVDDWDGRFNQGFRRGMVTIGIVVHGQSRIPGHGPGLVAILTGGTGRIRPRLTDDPAQNLVAWL